MAGSGNLMKLPSKSLPNTDTQAATLPVLFNAD
jgi:hypothetical protein